MRAKVDFRLYVITDRKQYRGVNLNDTIREACSAGIKAVQLREKDLDAGALADLGRQLKKICGRNTRLLINDRADVAHAISADGVHLTSGSLPAAVVRKAFPALQLLGVSTHSVQEALQAEAAGCDFIVYGPVFDTPSKRLYGPPLGLNKLREVTESVRIPVFAIGGINPDRAVACLQAGAHGVAVISAIMKAGTISAAVAAFADVVPEL